MQRTAICVTLLLGSSGATADILDFNSLDAGTIITNQFGDSNGVWIAALNPNRDHDAATLYNSLGVGGADTDLEGPEWDGGNLAADSVELGNLLIIAENIVDGDNDGLIDSPDDEGSRPAGSLIFEFASEQRVLGFDIVDLEDSELGSIELWLDGQLQETIEFIEFTQSDSGVYDPTVDFGDNHANRLSVLGPTSNLGYDRLVINLGGSAAVDNLVFAVPAPATLGLAALGLLAVGRRRG